MFVCVLGERLEIYNRVFVGNTRGGAEVGGMNAHVRWMEGSIYAIVNIGFLESVRWGGQGLTPGAGNLW